MKEITLSIPEDSVAALNLTVDGAAAEVRVAAAMRLFELGRLTSHDASRLAGIPQTEFEGRLAQEALPAVRLNPPTIEIPEAIFRRVAEIGRRIPDPVVEADGEL